MREQHIIFFFIIISVATHLHRGALLDMGMCDIFALPFLSALLQDNNKPMHHYQRILVFLCPLFIFALTALDDAAKAQSLPSRSPPLDFSTPSQRNIFIAVFDR